jgi:hypothetical protein
MSKTRSIKLQKRDWAIIVLFLAIISSNWLWYQQSKAQDITNKNNSSSWLMQQEEINRLKACINDDAKPCETTPTDY